MVRIPELFTGVFRRNTQRLDAECLNSAGEPEAKVDIDWPRSSCAALFYSTLGLAEPRKQRRTDL